MATTWTISTLERELSDGGVIVAHWRATDVDGDYSATSYGTCGFTYDASASDFTPYDDLTESQVLGWCWDNGVDQDAIEASLAAKIESDKNPTQANGVPW
tara:strand:+ start:1146 stop:1445 length:300 start_codon:yes stop_codon:yes gene_type:complete